MSDPFVHLHVASGYSLQYGAAHPHTLVRQAADHGMDTLALTDRDGVYGAVRFAKACASAGLRPVLGCDLAIAALPGLPQRPGRPQAPARRTPARGGAFVEDARAPRVLLLASGRTGWASLCRLISATHLAGERGKPVTSIDLIAEHVAGGDGGLVVLLGSDSVVGQALAARRPDAATGYLQAFQQVVPAGDLYLHVTHHRGPGEAVRAGRLVAFAAGQGLPVVLSNAVRYAHRADAPVADVLDAARRLVPLDPRHVQRRTSEGYLKSGKEMAEVAVEVAHHAGPVELPGARGGHRYGPDGLDGVASALLAATRRLADRCALSPRADLGIGEVHFPELEVSARGWTGAAPRPPAGDADAVLRARCEAGLGRRGVTPTPAVRHRLDDELAVIAGLGYPSYFLTVADVVDLIRGMGVRCAARGSGAGSLVTYLTGVSDVDPLRYGLLMERFLSPLRRQLPDVDIDVESARRTEVYEQVLARYGGDRCACVAMMDTYRARHALRDTGAALGLPPGEIDTIAKAFPHIRASQLRAALRDLPELRASGLSAQRLDLLLRLAERLDGLPRHIALHPCGVLLSDRTLLDRTPVEASFLGFPMSQFDKDDVEDLGLLKLDLLGIRMQSAISHAVAEVARVDGQQLDIDAVPRDDPATFGLIQSARTLGCFQIESPGQRELIGKFGPETFDDLIIDISLFRPGPVKSDMVRPFLEARQGWAVPRYAHPDLEPVLAETGGVVVFHEQVLRILAVLTGCTLAEADEYRRALGDPDAQEEVRTWFCPTALGRGYDLPTVEAVWEVLRAFGSFGFCKAHAAAFALPTYQSAWLKAHHPAAFLAGVLTHDPGMYPKRLILDDARQLGIAILPLDVNASGRDYQVERVGPLDEPPPHILDQPRAPGGSGVAGAGADPAAGRPSPAVRPGQWWPGGASGYGAADRPAAPVPAEPVTGADDALAPRQRPTDPRLPDGRRYGIRLGLADVKGISDAEISRLLRGRPYASLADLWHRAAPSRPVAERLVLAGALDSLYGIGTAVLRRRGQVTRRDLLLQVAELDTWSAAGRPRRSAQRRPTGGTGAAGAGAAGAGAAGAGAAGTGWGSRVLAQAAAQSQAAATVTPAAVQLTLDLQDAPSAVTPSGLPEMTAAERVHAELDVLGLDASSHVLDGYAPFLHELGVTRARDLLRCRSGSRLLVAGVKVATQTPPVRSGRRVVFLTLDDATGPLDATLFEDAQAGYAATVFHSWLLVVHGELRRTGPRGVSLRATGCWELPVLHAAWRAGGLAAVTPLLAAAPGWDNAGETATAGAAQSRSSRPVLASPILHSTGFAQSPYADIKPSGQDTRSGARKLWHASPGSAGR